MGKNETCMIFLEKLQICRGFLKLTLNYLSLINLFEYLPFALHACDLSSNFDLYRDKLHLKENSYCIHRIRKFQD